MTKIGDWAAFERVEGRKGNALLLLCDHASNHVPAHYGNLGVAAAQFQRHIAYDIGARDLTLALARRLEAPAVLSCFSRLLIDPNRGLIDPTLIMKISDGAIVPGNAYIDEVERQRRIDHYFVPYHRAIRQAIAAIEDQGLTPLIMSLHSFTPYWKGHPRPWHVGILWDVDGRVALPMIAALRRQDGLVVGDNEPYSGSLPGDTMNVHATDHGLPHALIEIRQDLIAGKSGVDDWCERLAPVIEATMKDPPGRIPVKETAHGA